MTIPSGTPKDMRFPVDSDDPESIQQGSFGILETGSGGTAHYKPISPDASDPSSVQLANADDTVQNTDFSSNYTVLTADAANNPSALQLPSSTVVGRSSSGGIVAMNGAQVASILNLQTDLTADGIGTSGDQIRLSGRHRYRTVSTTSDTPTSADMIVNVNLATIGDDCSLLIDATMLALEGKQLQINRIGAATGYKIKIWETAISGDPDYTIFGNEERINKFQISDGVLVGEGFSI